jgi:hypothetical protein
MKSFFLFMLASLLVITSAASAASDTTANSILDVFDAGPLLKFNVHRIEQRRRSWDEQQLLAALQGIVNRQQPRLYVFAIGHDGKIDRYWLKKLRKSGQWLSNTKLREKASLESLIDEYRSMIRGLVVWDERVPATALVASTAAGAEDLLPVRYDPHPKSLYTFLTTDAHGPRLPIRLRLLNADGSPMFTGSRTGSAKCDATLWAVEHFLQTGKCDPLHLAYYPDAYWLKKPPRTVANQTLLFNHDYFISKRAFFFDLSPWDDEAPNDDPHQRIGTDAMALQAMLRVAHDRANGHSICVGGFVPWTEKYTQFTHGHHEPVATEWRYADILSCFDGYMDADAPAAGEMANASVFCHFPLADQYPQRKIVSPTDLRRMHLLDSDDNVRPGNYATIYVGDYDSSAWLYQKMPDLWDDPKRGRVPLGWAFDPSLEKRFPVGLAYARATATPNDSFIAGDSGYGYLNPGDLVSPRQWSGLPSGLPGWQQLCQEGYRRWDLRITGFVINGFAPPMNQEVESAYAQFSPDGVISQSVPRLSYINGVPLVLMASDLSNPTQGAKQISRYFPRSRSATPNFGVFRTILWSPSRHVQLFKLLSRQRHDITIVSPQVLMELAKLADGAHRK